MKLAHAKRAKLLFFIVKYENFVVAVIVVVALPNNYLQQNGLGDGSNPLSTIWRL